MNYIVLYILLGWVLFLMVGFFYSLLTKSKKSIGTKKLSNNPLKKNYNKQPNAYAICRAMQKKYGWTKEKYKRCVRHIINKE